MKIRKTQREDIPAVMQIITQAQSALKKMGLTQWQDGYPDAARIAADIANDWSYVLCEGDAVLATVAISFDGDANYNEIDGAWCADCAYAVLHRVAVAEGSKGKGLARVMIDFAASLCENASAKSMRADTHCGNVPMQLALEKAGFVRCGIIFLDGVHDEIHARLAYEKMI